MTAQHDIFKNRHISEQLNRLKSPGNTPVRNLVGLEILNGSALEPHRSPCWRKRSGNNIKQGCLAGAVGTDNRLNHSFPDLKIKVAQRH